MKILFFCHYFPPEVNAPASRTYEHCKRWVEAGHDVTVVTCVPNCPDGVVFGGYQNRLRAQHELIDGIRVVRVWTLLAPNAGTVRRIANYLSYCLSSVIASLSLKRPDVIVATSPQFFCGWAGVWVSRLKRTPLILEIRDIWPESIAAVGAMKKGVAVRFLEFLEKRMYRAADRIVAVGNGYRDKILERSSSTVHPIAVVTNGVDPERYTPADKDESFLNQYGLQQRFIVSYVGTVGMACGLEVVVRAAEKLRGLGREDIAFLIVGDGANRSRLEQMTDDLSLGDTIIFTGRLSKERMPTVLASSDACLVHLHGTELFGTVIPSKIFETMAMRRPIIMGVKGPAREIVIDAQAGVAMEPDNEDDLVRIVIEMADNADTTAVIGQQAREYVVEHYNRDRKAEEMLKVLTECI